MKNSTASVLLKRFSQNLKSNNCSIYGFNLRNPLVKGMKPTKQTSWNYDVYKINITSDEKIVQLLGTTPKLTWAKADPISITDNVDFNSKGVIELLNKLPEDLKEYLREVFKKEEG
ncbi:hypothetical protein [Ekhidna sp.]